LGDVVLGAGCWVLGAGCWVLDGLQKFLPEASSLYLRIDLFHPLVVTKQQTFHNNKSFK